MLLSIKNLKKVYNNGTEALKGVSFNIEDSEILGLLGPNGSGKTTLSSIIATLHPPTSGDILYKGQSIYNNITDFRRIIGFCQQNPNLNPQLTVSENLYYDGTYYGLSHQDSKKKMTKLIEKYGLDKYVDAFPDMLSGGYKQRVMIARALMHDPKIVLFDEPTVGLDPHIRIKLWEDILNLKKEGKTIVLTTHYLDEAEKLSDRICLLDQGLVRLIDTPSNLIQLHGKANLEDVFVKLMEEETK